MEPLLSFYEYCKANDVDVMSYSRLPADACTVRDRGYYCVVLNPVQLSTFRKVRTAAIHEEGHLRTGALHKVDSPYQLVAQSEYRADAAAFQRYLPPDKLRTAMRAGYTRTLAAGRLFRPGRRLHKKKPCTTGQSAGVLISISKAGGTLKRLLQNRAVRPYLITYLVWLIFLLLLILSSTTEDGAPYPIGPGIFVAIVSAFVFSLPVWIVQFVWIQLRPKKARKISAFTPPLTVPQETEKTDTTAPDDFTDPRQAPFPQRQQRRIQSAQAIRMEEKRQRQAAAQKRIDENLARLEEAKATAAALQRKPHPGNPGDGSPAASHRCDPVFGVQNVSFRRHTQNRIPVPGR